MNELKRAESCYGQQPLRSRWLRDTSRFYDGERKQDPRNIIAAAVERICLIFSGAAFNKLRDYRRISLYFSENWKSSKYYEIIIIDKKIIR